MQTGSKSAKPMIKRIWHGWTSPENADAYEALLEGEIFPGIREKNIPGYRGISLLRRDDQNEVAFVTIMSFELMDSARALSGDDSSRAYVPDSARALLSRWDDSSKIYEVRQEQQC